MKDSDKPKLILAIVLLVAAAALILWYNGVFEGGATKTPPVVPQDQIKAGGARKAPGT